MDTEGMLDRLPPWLIAILVLIAGVALGITADRSPLTDKADETAIRNFRTPKANLESVYGGGPVGSPYLFDLDDPAKLLLGVDRVDVPRNPQGIALVGDPQNDVHLF